MKRQPSYISTSILFVFILCLLMGGCATSQSIQRLKTDSNFKEAAQQLTMAYLGSQRKGDSSIQFGPGSGSFYNLDEYQIIQFGQENNQPVVFIRVKMRAKTGSKPIWTNYAIQFSHDPELEATGDKYLGLRIDSINETLEKF